MNYIPAQEIIREFKNEMSSYFEKGMLDESLLYPVVSTCLSKMGMRILPVRKEVIKIESYKAELPCDFYKAITLMGCGIVAGQDIDLINTKLEEYYVTGLDVGSLNCDYCEDACGNVYGIKQYVKGVTTVYDELYPLKVALDSKPFCAESCFEYQRSNDEVSIKNGMIYTNFESGHIFIEYLTNLEGDQDIMVPDHRTIVEWIKMEMMYVCFRKLYINNEADVMQRLNWATQQLAIYQTNASTLYRMFSTKDFYQLRKVLSSRFNKYNTVVYGKYYNDKYSLRSVPTKI